MKKSYYWLLAAMFSLVACSIVRGPGTPVRVVVQLREAPDGSPTPYQLVVDTLRIRKLVATTTATTAAPLGMGPLPVDIYTTTSYDLSQRLLRQMRRVARQNRATRQAIKHYNPDWKPLLLPQKNLLMRKFTTGRRMARANFLSATQDRIEKLLDLARRADTTRLCNLPAAHYQLSPTNTAPAAVPGAAAQQVIFSQASILPLTPAQRTLEVTITDKGQSALMRYYVCARYSTSDVTKSYVSVQTTESECPPQSGYVTVTVPFLQLDRALFVERMLAALKPGSLVENTAANQLLRSSQQAEIAHSLALQERQKVLTDSVRIYQQKRSAINKQRLDATGRIKQDSVLNKVLYSDSSALTVKITAVKSQIAALDKQIKQKPKNGKQRLSKEQLKQLKTKEEDLVKQQQHLIKQKETINNARALRATRNNLDTLQKRNSQFLAIAQSSQGTTGDVLRLTQKSINKLTNRLDSVARALSKTVQDSAKKPPTLDVLNVDPSLNTDPTNALRNALTDAYLALVREQTQYLDEPQAGVMDVLEGGNVYVPTITRPQWCFQLDATEIEVEDGMVLGLKATGRNVNTGQLVVFESRAPIGISSDRDLYREWPRQRLWLQYPLFGNTPHQPAYIHLTDVLRYYPRLAAQAGDRSPADQVYVMHPNDPLSERTMNKMATQKILQGRLYTDLAGVRSENPNGLVQLEVDRRFNFGTTWSKFSPNFQLQSFGYFTPSVSITKLEQQNRYLPLERTAQRGIYRVQTIDLLRYTNFRVGGDYNLLGLRLPRFKSDFAFDFCFGLQRVDIRDTLRRVSHPTLVSRVDTTVNVGMYGFSLKARVRPDSRYGITARVGYNRYTLFNSRDDRLFIDQRPDVSERVGNTTFGRVLKEYWFQGVIQYELTGRLKIAENAEYFIRPQFSHLLYYSYRTYFQIQTGFQFNIFGPRRETPPGPASPWNNPHIGGVQASSRL